MGYVILLRDTCMLSCLGFFRQQAFCLYYFKLFLFLFIYFSGDVISRVDRAIRLIINSISKFLQMKLIVTRFNDLQIHFTFIYEDEKDALYFN